MAVTVKANVVRMTTVGDLLAVPLNVVGIAVEGTGAGTVDIQDGAGNAVIRVNTTAIGVTQFFPTIQNFPSGLKYGAGTTANIVIFLAPPIGG